MSLWRTLEPSFTFNELVRRMRGSWGNFLADDNCWVIGQDEIKDVAGFVRRLEYLLLKEEMGHEVGHQGEHHSFIG